MLPLTDWAPLLSFVCFFPLNVGRSYKLEPNMFKALPCAWLCSLLPLIIFFSEDVSNQWSPKQSFHYIRFQFWELSSLSKMRMCFFQFLSLLFSCEVAGRAKISSKHVLFCVLMCFFCQVWMNKVKLSERHRLRFWQNRYDAHWWSKQSAYGVFWSGS